MASLPPEIVTARSVEFGSISLATCIEAPVISLISLILDPPLPIRDPHCEAGTIKRKVIGGLGTEGEVTKAERSSSNLAQIRVNAFKMDWLVPITVTIRSGQDPSVMLIFAPLSSLKRLTMSPFLPMILPTSFPCIISLMERVGRSVDITRVAIALTVLESHKLSCLVSESFIDF